MGKYNRPGNAKKESDFLILERDITYANNVPPQIAALVEVGVQQTLVKFNKTADNRQYGGNLAGGRSLAAGGTLFASERASHSSGASILQGVAGCGGNTRGGGH